jgi:hypothetical protein
MAQPHLDVSRTRLYELRAEFLRDRDNFAAKASGGGHHGPSPAKAVTFLKRFPPLQSPPNYQLVADELERLCGFKRARSNVVAYVKAHLPHLVPARPRKNRPYRRFHRADIGKFWQHDSSIHQWWPAPAKQILLLTAYDHSGLNLGGRFVTADTTWNHFCHFRALFEDYGIPEAIHTDALRASSAPVPAAITATPGASSSASCGFWAWPIWSHPHPRPKARSSAVSAPSSAAW